MTGFDSLIPKKALFIDLAYGRIGKFDKVEKSSTGDKIDIYYTPFNSLRSKVIPRVKKTSLRYVPCSHHKMYSAGIHVLLDEDGESPLLDKLGSDLGELAREIEDKKMQDELEKKGLKYSEKRARLEPARVLDEQSGQIDKITKRHRQKEIGTPFSGRHRGD